MNNISFFYNRNVIHPSLNISAKKYAEEWNNEFSNLVDFFSKKFSNSIFKIIDLEDSNRLKNYSNDIEYIDEYQLENTIKLCKFFNFSLLATELEYCYVITLNNNISNNEANNQFELLTKLFKTEIYSPIENKYNIPYMFVENFLEKKIQVSKKEENVSLEYPINLINNKIPQNEFAFF